MYRKQSEITKESLHLPSDDCVTTDIFYSSALPDRLYQQASEFCQSKGGVTVPLNSHSRGL
jgi:hypothetical protein